MDEPQPMLTVSQMAARLSVSPELVYRMCRTHQWPYSKIGRLYRFTEDHYQAIIATPVRAEPKPRNQREHVASLLRSTNYDVEAR